ncbi:hypothetical protein RF11_15323 [Thelohanellus kitauei]|uniref:Uncharacterized protein n=1 Tax=Thelohanellus kitauei TaxID=669202 RepID=A0A0C2MXM5_THEKT|nr:hypothetical protein RF11_15323 [Thelohanellus kitauei]
MYKRLLFNSRSGARSLLKNVTVITHYEGAKRKHADHLRERNVAPHTRVTPCDESLNPSKENDIKPIKENEPARSDFLRRENTINATVDSSDEVKPTYTISALESFKPRRSERLKENMEARAGNKSVNIIYEQIKLVVYTHNHGRRACTIRSLSQQIKIQYTRERIILIATLLRLPKTSYIILSYEFHVTFCNERCVAFDNRDRPGSRYIILATERSLSILSVSNKHLF